jgi:hypothetical protein
MASGAIAAGVIGGASIIGGAAAAVRAQRMKTNPRGVTYGGNADTQDALLDDYGQGVAQGNGAVTSGLTGLQSGFIGGVQQRQTGQALIDSAASSTPAPTGQGMSILQGYQPGQVAATQQQVALDQGALQTLSAGRTGGALGLRNALVANAGNTMQVGQAAAAQRAQEQQSYVAAQVAQANQDKANQFSANGQRLQQLQLGGGIMATGNGQATGAAGTITSAGLNDQGQYLGQQQNVYDSQAGLNQTYETNRQQNQVRKSQNLWNLGGSLVGSGVSTLSKAAA